MKYKWICQEQDSLNIKKKKLYQNLKRIRSKHSQPINVEVNCLSHQKAIQTFLHQSPWIKQLSIISPRIIIYYHIAGLGNWKDIVKEQLECIKTSQLYDRCYEIRIGFLGKIEDIQPFLNEKIKLVNHSEHLEYYEIPTINKMIEFCKNNQEQSYILYIHNKGSTHKICNGIHGQKYWREMMNYWCVEKHLDMLYQLQSGYYTAGINLMGKNHYSGNFWWANSQYLAKSRYLRDQLGKINRISAEFFLLKHRVESRHISLYGPYINSIDCKGLYGRKIDKVEYSNPDIRII